MVEASQRPRPFGASSSPPTSMPIPSPSLSCPCRLVPCPRRRRRRCSATTHTDLELRARQQGVPVRVVHNASIMNAVGACGLQLYRFGEAVSIVFFTGRGGGV